MQQYLDLLKDVYYGGTYEETRTVLRSTGEPVRAFSLFGCHLRFDLAAGFPLVTTKKVDFGAVAHELVWFLSGDTNVKYLRDNGVKIWDAWADVNGDLGPVYGELWRRWPAPGGGTFDQIAALVAGIRGVMADPRDPRARRLVLTAWNPAMQPEVAPVGCHTTAIFHVSRGELSCLLTCRSIDLFLGLPYNIACYAALVHLLARVTGLVPGELDIAIANAHIYENHVDQVKEQLGRDPLPLPTLRIDPAVREVDDARRGHFILEGYEHRPALRGEVAV